MKSYIFLILIVLAANGSSKPIDSDDEFVAVDPYDGSSLEAYKYYVQQAEDETANSSVDSSELVKREVTTIAAEESSSTAEATSTQKPHFFLSDLISRVEGAIVNSAQSVVSVVKFSQNETEISVSSTPTPRVVRRSTDLQNEDASEEPEPLYKVQSAKLVAASPDQPAHVLIDRVSVYQAGPSFLPLISDFSFQLPSPKPSDTLSLDGNDEDAVSVQELRDKLVPLSSIQDSEIAKREVPNALPLTADINDKPATHNPLSSDVKENTAETEIKPTSPGGILGKISAQRTAASSTVKTPTDITVKGGSVSQLSISLSTVSHSSSTTPSTTSTASSTTTQKTPVEQLKETEKEVKEKVAEIEADPVILSARV